MITKNTDLPKTFEEAISIVKKAVLESSSNKDIISKKVSPKDIVVECHHGYGRTIRNEFGLWQDDAPLTKDMKAMGFMHPDDMSTAIIMAAISDIQNIPRSTEELLKEYSNYWNAINMKEALE